MTWLSPDDWRPVGVESLEGAAMDAVRHPGAVAVTAGPGAGKTEFLTQKCSYLMSTGACGPTRRILTISYKRDAAREVSERISDRLPTPHAARVRCATFDEFTKGLVDRFGRLLPPVWRPAPNLELEPAKFPGGLTKGRLQECRLAAAGASGMAESGVLDDVIEWWKGAYLDSDEPFVNFVMLNRLAELLVRHDRRLARGLRWTYSHVLVDEFQDTTSSQLDFLCSVFAGYATITVVADDKQRIMAWAGAMPDAVDRAIETFGAKKFELLINYRSTQSLVDIQRHVALAIDPRVAEVTSARETQIDEDAASIWEFESILDHDAAIARWIAETVDEGTCPHEQVMILTRSKADQIASRMEPHLSAAGLPLLNLSQHFGRFTLEDLLTEDFTGVVVGLLRCAAGRSPAHFDFLVDVYQVADGVSDEGADGAHRARRRLLADIHAASSLFPLIVDDAVVDSLVDGVLAIVERVRVVRAFRRYQLDSARLGMAVDAIKDRFRDVASKSSSWAQVLDRFEGVGCVRLMTVHKSKGREAHTVAFIEIDDNRWWVKSAADEQEQRSTFFVGLSRAEDRVIFTYVRSRLGDISAGLLSLLEGAGVAIIRP